MTASPNDLTAFDSAAKTLYKDGNFEELVLKNRPLTGLLPKFEGFGGRNMQIVWLFGNPQAVSATFSTAQSYSTNAYVGKVKVEDVLLTRVKSYGMFTIDGETIDALTGDETSFIVAMKSTIDAAIRSMADAVETSLFRSRYGSIAAVTGVADAASYYFDVDVDATPLFEPQMALVASSSTEGSTLLGTSSQVLVVSRVDRANGHIYVTSTAGVNVNPCSDVASTGWTSSFAAGCLVYRAGDQDGSSSVVKFAGLAEWLPTSISTSDSFFGANRSVDSRMWGVPLTADTDTVEDAFLDSISLACREGGDPDVIVCNNKQYRRLVKQLGAKRIYAQMNAKSSDGIYANVGYKGVVVDGERGPVTILAAPRCQVNTAWTLTSSTLLLATLGPIVHFTEYDGLRILRQASDDGVEGRLVCRGNLACRAPIWNNRVALAS